MSLWIKLSSVQAAFFEDKPVEALFDIDNDPFETVNLAENPDYQDKLIELRGALNKQQQAIPDLGFIAESRLLQTKLETSYYDYGQQHHQKPRIWAQLCVVQPNFESVLVFSCLYTSFIF